MSHMGLLLSIELAWTLACTLIVLPALLACMPGRPSGGRYLGVGADHGNLSSGR
jgi:hypothetical protein